MRLSATTYGTVNDTALHYNEWLLLKWVWYIINIRIGDFIIINLWASILFAEIFQTFCMFP